MARVLVFGGTGFVGSHAVEACLDAGHEVVVATGPGPEPDPLANADRVGVVPGDLLHWPELLAGLLDRSTTPDRVYRHEWAVGDTVIWDNRGVLHRAAPYPTDSPREMFRTTILGDEPIE
jgi:alpha-ketoglutarate-dependent taurine dioxygenase